jgi:hypothetical protein
VVAATTSVQMRSLGDLRSPGAGIYCSQLAMIKQLIRLTCAILVGSPSTLSATLDATLLPSVAI